MRLLISPESYTSNSFFQKDIKKIRKGWHFVCLKSDIKKNNDYIALDLFDIPITVQNFKNKYKAFLNICSHRLNKIRSKSKGNGILRCLYHGWTFNSKGEPYGIPMKDSLFKITNEDLKRLTLKEFNIDICGEFIFLNIESKKTLKQYLGKYYKELKNISINLGSEIKTNIFHYNANWKVCIENTIDEYHVASVHPNTFNKVLGSEIKYDYDKLNNGVQINCNKKFLKKWRPIENKINDRGYKINGYRHIFIYPLFTAASTLGTSFSLQWFRPISENKTEIISRLFSFNLKKEKNEITNFLDNSVEKFNHEVFHEDKEVCEDVHNGLLKKEFSEQFGILGKNESRIVHFHKNYLRNIK